MYNPWEKIPLNDYENHMKLNSVMQLQADSVANLPDDSDKFSKKSKNGFLCTSEKYACNCTGNIV